jgi:hypothetical protein
MVQIMSENNRLRADVVGKTSDLELALTRAKENSARLEQERDKLRAEVYDFKSQQTGHFTHTSPSI